jgi:hypothetical protein
VSLRGRASGSGCGPKLDISEGEGKKAHFLAIVAIDPDCSGKPVYVWRRGHINENEDVTGSYQPEAGEKLPKLSAPGKGKQRRYSSEH